MIAYKVLGTDGKAAAWAVEDAVESAKAAARAAAWAAADAAEAAKAAGNAGWAAEDAERSWQAARLAELLDIPCEEQQIGGVS